MNNSKNLKIYNGMDTIYFFVADKKRPDILKPGKASKIVDRLRNFNVGRIDDVELKYLALVKNPLLIERCIKQLLKKNQYKPNKELFKIEPVDLKNIILKCFTKCASNQENLELYNEISALLGMYSYVKDKPQLKPFIIIGNNL
jgi:hypothetical protein